MNRTYEVQLREAYAVGVLTFLYIASVLAYTVLID